ncbi:hypothetical protein ABZ502_17065 [Streptomyces abikoensis]|uniref:hypothetical protein n=1 Tax=Streptomyces abikoensis TaxID=97398 RepID=UPI0033C8BAB3
MRWRVGRHGFLKPSTARSRTTGSTGQESQELNAEALGVERENRPVGWTAGAVVSESELRRATRREMRLLGIKPPLNVETLCQAIGEKLGRPIELRPWPLPKPGPLGVMAETDVAYVILYQAETTRLHQEHIILHEIGHILGDHQGITLDVSQNLAVAGLKDSAVRRILGRCSYDSGQECQAELFATIMLEWASVLDCVTPSPSADPSVRRVQDALGDRRGWL